MTVAREARAKADSGRGWYAWLARGGLVAKGISYGLVGVLAIRLAVGFGGSATSRQGALQTLAQHALGKVVLVLLALGFAAYAAWRFVQALVERDEDGEAKAWAKRAGYVGRGVIYAGLTYSSVKILAGARGTHGGNTKQTTATVFDWPAGRWLVGLAGLVVAGVGCWNLYRGLTRKFEEKWRTGAMGPGARRWGARAGVAGHVARFVVFGLIGVFLVVAAVQHDSKEAVGLDGALEKLARADYGPYLLGLTAAGLVCYGLFCLADARFRDVSQR